MNYFASNQQVFHRTTDRGPGMTHCAWPTNKGEFFDEPPEDRRPCKICFPSHELTNSVPLTVVGRVDDLLILRIPARVRQSAWPFTEKVVVEMPREILIPIKTT